MTTNNMQTPAVAAQDNTQTEKAWTYRLVHSPGRTNVGIIDAQTNELLGHVELQAVHKQAYYAFEALIAKGRYTCTAGSKLDAKVSEHLATLKARREELAVADTTFFGLIGR